VKFTVKKGPESIVQVEGEVDHFNIEPLANEVKMLLSQSNNLILDLTKSGYIDSAGVNMIFFAAKSAGDKGGNIRLIVRSKEIRRILEIAGADKMGNISIQSSLK